MPLSTSAGRCLEAPERHLRRAEQRDVHQRAPLQRARRARMRRRRAPAARALPAQEQRKVRER